ncbi:hypothetical protein [Epibacterium ulvae]|uniref:hypothetical protein n=1 Tax=Epibacterium ulvae TaxID=1156985 RepID=UPI0024931886|nr:hypothetical protein [Epibacterium ulvae]
MRIQDSIELSTPQSQQVDEQLRPAKKKAAPQGAMNTSTPKSAPRQSAVFDEANQKSKGPARTKRAPAASLSTVTGLPQRPATFISTNFEGSTRGSFDPNAEGDGYYTKFGQNIERGECAGACLVKAKEVLEGKKKVSETPPDAFQKALAQVKVHQVWAGVTSKDQSLNNEETPSSAGYPSLAKSFGLEATNYDGIAPGMIRDIQAENPDKPIILTLNDGVNWGHSVMIYEENDQLYFFDPTTKNLPIDTIEQLEDLLTEVAFDLDRGYGDENATEFNVTLSATVLENSDESVIETSTVQFKPPVDKIYNDREND